VQEAQHSDAHPLQQLPVGQAVKWDPRPLSTSLPECQCNQQLYGSYHLMAATHNPVLQWGGGCLLPTL